MRDLRILLAYLSCLTLVTADFEPGQHLQDVHVHTLDGTFRIAPEQRGRPLLIMASDLHDASIRWMWSAAKSKLDFVTKLPQADCLFLSYGSNAEEETKKFKMELVKAMEAADWDESSRAQLFSRLHFATEPVSSQPGWLPGVLQAWPSSQHVIRAESTGIEVLTMERLDPAYEWLPWPGPSSPTSLALVHDSPCEGPWASSVAGRVALIILQDPAASPAGSLGLQAATCSFARIIELAQDAQAAAVLIASKPGHDVVQMTCDSPADCSIPLYTPATMISHSAAVQLRNLLSQATTNQSSISVSFGNLQVPGYFAAVDEEGRLQE
ncbi:hypothetical protein WJX84_008586, partial [Apatococcus fuscideae]